MSDAIAKAKADLEAKFADAREMVKDKDPVTKALVEATIKMARMVTSIGERDPVMRAVAKAAFDKREAEQVAEAVKEAATKAPEEFH